MALYKQTELKQGLEKSVEAFSDKLKQLRVGRPKAEMFNEISIQAYGMASNVQSLANVIIESATSVVIQPWDKSIIQDVLKGVRDANLGYEPVLDGDKVRINIPALTNERRQETIKEMRQLLEEAKVHVRQIRHQFMEQVDKQEGVSEDEQKRDRADIQKQIDEVNTRLDDMAEAKESELDTL